MVNDLRVCERLAHSHLVPPTQRDERKRVTAVYWCSSGSPCLRPDAEQEGRGPGSTGY
jgi:hypothetical protein